MQSVELKVGIIRAGFTQRQLALDLRLPECDLSRYVRGTGIPPPATRRRIAKALGLCEADLFPASNDKLAEVG
jgi:transcriptional regulator with XRE-family HTH domain